MTAAELVAAVAACDALTAMADVFRRALGFPILTRRARRGAFACVDDVPDAEVLSCFRNLGSPMDGRM